MSVRCGLPPRTTSSTTTTTVSTTASVLTKTSLESIVSSTESKDVFNNKNGARLSPRYVLIIGTAYLKYSLKILTTSDLLNTTGAYFSTTYSLNTGTADLSSSSNDPTTMNPETKKDAYSTITNVLKTSTAYLKSSLENSVNSDPENICNWTYSKSVAIKLCRNLNATVIVWRYNDVYDADPYFNIFHLNNKSLIW